MKPFVASLLVPLATVLLPALSASAQTEPAAIVQQVNVSAALDLSLRSHDDWALPVSVAPALDLSPRSHDDWAVTSAS